MSDRLEKALDADFDAMPVDELIAAAEEIKEAATDLLESTVDLSEVTSIELEAKGWSWPPLHVVGADILKEASTGERFLRVWCSCSWRGENIELVSPVVDLLHTGQAANEEAARQWRAHYRLSNRIVRADKRLHALPEHQPIEEEK